MTKITLSEIGEKKLTVLICKYFDPSPYSVVGLGDDAAILDIGLGSQLLAAKIDKGARPPTYLCGVRDVGTEGRWAIAAAVSDLAAKGAKPLALFLSLCLPHDMKLSHVKKLLRAIKQCARQYGTFVVCGDTKRADELMIFVAAIGLVRRGRQITRSNAKVGDIVAVTGNLGNVWCLIYTATRKIGLPANFRNKLTRYLTHPNVPVSSLLKIAESKIANASMDISDGLAGALWEISKASKVRVVVDAAKIPVSSEVRYVGKMLHIEPYKFAMDMGGDWQTLLTVKSERWNYAKRLHGKDLIPIGQIERGRDVHIRLGNRSRLLPNFQDDRFLIRNLDDGIDLWEKTFRVSVREGGSS